MATYTNETVTTTTRRYLLPLPSNGVELAKMKTAAYQQWREDFPAGELTDDAITIIAENDVLTFSWTIPAQTPADAVKNARSIWMSGYDAGYNGMWRSTNPYPES